MNSRRLMATLALLAGAGSGADFAIPDAGATPADRAGLAGTSAALPMQEPPPAISSMGIVRIRKEVSIGWIAAFGTVVTARQSTSDGVTLNQETSSVGLPATFQVFGVEDAVDCYVATDIRRQNLVVLRCGDLGSAPIDLGPANLPVGTPVTLAVLPANLKLTTQPGIVVADKVMFMRKPQPRFSFGRDVKNTNAGNFIGSPVLNSAGDVVSVVFAEADSGQQPLGLTKAQITSALGAASKLPDSYATAVLLSIGKRSLVPVLVGLVLGALWAWRVPGANRVWRFVAPMFAGILGAAAVTVFQILVLGGGAAIG